MINSDFVAVLKFLVERLSTSNINWAITGSTSFALQGLHYDPEDIDIQTDKKGAYEIESLFMDHVRRHVGFSSSGFIRSHFGELIINGISVEIIGDIEKIVDGEWEKVPNLNEIKQLVRVFNLELPVLTLEYEAQAYEKLGRKDQAETLLKHISNPNIFNYHERTD
ncbi:nucleotidyltransferase domain-containing protein [Paenibacillus radicis (ex Xue et al. 2023)]|uniref:Uncharacterized protein n=1 Tax=Paenibacillus radicis (ex Xue et al. 2023) TaxID=2972489 RepID=A0ABT1YG96_9BACL|nr:hypothetical protein [Paenibacillus radicis (ex Xue et al. 2023)]MCR8632223.1 hypothetical protein [Paenibacillus radicis (ex Xue et al. 2023)]